MTRAATAVTSKRSSYLDGRISRIFIPEDSRIYVSPKIGVFIENFQFQNDDQLRPQNQASDPAVGGHFRLVTIDFSGDTHPIKRLPLGLQSLGLAQKDSLLHLMI
jgi:hypothetical protein